MQISHVYEYNETITTGNNSLSSTIPDDLMELNLMSLDLSEYLIEEMCAISNPISNQISN